ncbi:MAG TPA: RNA-processing protein [Methanocorpusculum sp.]|nr:RNA-processing protein [Methanocorpusculum sp.]
MNWYGEPNSVSIQYEDAKKRITDAKMPVRLCDWHEVKKAGLVSDRMEYLQALRAVTMKMAEEGIAESLSAKDNALLQMVRMLDEIDNVINLLTERITEWYSATTPSYSRKYTRSNPARLLQTLAKSDNPSMKRTAREIQGLNETRLALMKEVSREADAVLPNMSALVGGLVAARIVSRAGGLEELSRKAGSSIQVLGAESALFSHIRTGSTSPKHGIIFQHRRVHNAPKDARGKTARLLASKLAIAARLDLYRGEADPAFIADANVKIDAVCGGGAK